MKESKGEKNASREVRECRVQNSSVPELRTKHKILPAQRDQLKAMMHNLSHANTCKLGLLRNRIAYVERERKKERGFCHLSHWNLSTTSACKEEKKQESSNHANNRYKSLLINDCICIFLSISFFGHCKEGG